MDSDSEYSADARGRGDNGASGQDWGATDSLRRNARLDRKLDDEVTPLLANGGERSDSGDESSATANKAWDGNADFEGLAWWQRPSVGGVQLLLKLDFTDVVKSCTGCCRPSSSSHWLSGACLSRNST